MIPRVVSKWEMAVGLSVVALTLWGTHRFVVPFYNHSYPFAWYGLILFLDGLLWYRWDEGFIFRRPAEFFTLLFWSAVIWFFFEIWNLRLQNWYYAGVSPNALWAHAEAYLDFATVLPGLFLVYRLLCRLGIPGPVTSPWGLSPTVRRVAPFLGACMVLLPLVYPDFFYPLVWGAFFFLLDPLCAANGRQSLLQDAERGQWTTLVRLLLAGLFCGGYWEVCNHGSLAKWIYTVPLFSQGKLFEMPYLGFLGFPPFCVECFVMVNALYLLRGGRHWNPDVANPRQNPCFLQAVYLLAVLLGVGLSEWSYNRLDRHTVDSRAETVLEAVSDIAPDDGKRLVEAGWRFPAQVLECWEASRLWIDAPNRERIRARLQMAVLMNMGSANARLLESVGIMTIATLGSQEPDPLFARLVQTNEKLNLRKVPVVKRRVTAWIRGADRRSFLY